LAHCFEIDLFLTQPDGEPVMLVETDPRREGEVRAHANEHASPAGIVEVEVILDDPALGHLQMPMIILLVTVGNEDPSRLTGS
jgi:hypothetical protein